ncbi:MAG TPA: CBS domain-containing protein [Gaiellaceae bacterium]|jgi:CBS domain-containing protein
MTAADVMLRDPKTLPGGATVDEVRAVLANPKVQMVLLADDRRFRGAITAIPDGAVGDEPAVAYADSSPETIAPTETAEFAFERATATPHRRVIVLGDDDQLLGLLCLNVSRTNFCQTSN